MERLLLPALVLALVASWLLWGLNLIYAVEDLSDVSILGLAEEDIPYLARVDLSTATTLVLALTLLRVTQGVRRVREPWRPGFPFSSRFRNLLIQLGLLGTIFAFIVAFGDMADFARSKATDSPTYDPAILIAPLGTALWSTFAGIAVAFLVLPPIEGLFKKAMRPGEDGAQKEVEAVGRSIEELEHQARDSAAALERLGGRVAALDAILGRTESFKKAMALGEELRDALDRLDGAARELKPVFETTREALAAFPDPVRGATELVRSLSGELTLHRRAALQLSKSLDGACRFLPVLTDPRRGMGAVVDGLAETGAGLHGVVEALRAAPEAPRWPALEGSPLGQELAALSIQLVRLETRIETLSRMMQAQGSGGPGEPRPGILETIRVWLDRWRKAA